ncbi:hypothetical protein BOX15_Mlig009355g2 [Macrostomum lignano]|uniref:Uncharacterized protein n=1 Tax=Macrostomum lignano TaxID=282301 RepID=A0A267DSP7_9PLAT|nr:hypothetical protein BOX15_Mlig030190g2 [Macrostomum lignano]PAA52186.1 hypothetical protein BOX15_Mlig030190g1 [Macrostomum lignano]PAA85832.1 hypothetical protein BOX15_Mlig009355g2 [Macrostomum lignano]
MKMQLGIALLLTLFLVSQLAASNQWDQVEEPDSLDDIAGESLDEPLEADDDYDEEVQPVAKWRRRRLSYGKK